MPRNCFAKPGSTWNAWQSNLDSVRRVSFAALGREFTRRLHAKLESTHTPRTLRSAAITTWRPEQPSASTHVFILHVGTICPAVLTSDAHVLEELRSIQTHSQGGVMNGHVVR